jgi:hypothetical protein
MMMGTNLKAEKIVEKIGKTYLEGELMINQGQDKDHLILVG